MRSDPSAANPRAGRALARTKLVQAIVAALLYGLGGCSNTPPSLGQAAKGDMAALQTTKAPAPAPTTPFRDASGATHTLADFRGKVVIVNLWANWCAPCKQEIPSLAKLQTAYAGKAVAIVPISVGKGADEVAGRAFIARNPPLAFYTEPTYALPFAFAPPVEGMPTTILFDRRGVERARLSGGADWSGPDARRVVDALLAQT